jgi:hypothetical protein
MALVLQYEPRLSRQDAGTKLLMYAMYGEHTNRPRPTTPEQAQALIASLGLTWDSMVESCRDYRQPVLHFENMLRGTWTTEGGGQFVVIDNRTGRELAQLTGAGELSMFEYLAHFDAATTARDRAVERSSYADAETAVVRGFGSIEAFLAQAAHDWNERHPEHSLVDASGKRARFDQKLDEWIPILSSGRRVEKGGQHWSDMVKLKQVRDNVAHPKRLARAVPLTETAELLNAFRQGIGAMLGHLHLLLGSPVPASILNAIHMPRVAVTARG